VPHVGNRANCFLLATLLQDGHALVEKETARRVSRPLKDSDICAPDRESATSVYSPQLVDDGYVRIFSMGGAIHKENKPSIKSFVDLGVVKTSEGPHCAVWTLRPNDGKYP